MKNAVAILGVVSLVGGIYLLILAATGEKWRFKK